MENRLVLLSRLLKNLGQVIFIVGGGCPASQRTFGCIPGLDPLDASNVSLPPSLLYPVVKTKKCFQTLPRSPGGKTIPLRITVLGQQNTLITYKQNQTTGAIK